MLFTARGRGRLHQRRDPVRRDDPPVGRRRHAARAACSNDAGDHPRHQGRPRARSRSRSPGETVTEGLDGLRERLVEYRDLGARFAKWRAVINDRRRDPERSTASTSTRTRSPATPRCARSEGIVPIVEPEVLMDGDHTIERCYEVTTDTLHARLPRAGRRSGSSSRACCSSRTWCSRASECPSRRRVEEVADATMRCFRVAVPAAVPGIVFLSGGQSDEERHRAPRRDEPARPAPVAAVASRTAVRSRRPRSRRGRATRATSTPGEARSCTGPGCNGAARSGTLHAPTWSSSSRPDRRRRPYRRCHAGARAAGHGRARARRRRGRSARSARASACSSASPTTTRAPGAKLADKVWNLRVFDDDVGQMNRRRSDAVGRSWSCSQFTLYGDTTRGRRRRGSRRPRPSSRRAAWSARSRPTSRRSGPPSPPAGSGPDMQVELVNDGPVT